MMFKSVLLVSLCVAACSAVKWTGAGGNGLWSYGPNWDTNVIPTSSDDVYLQFAGNATITVSAAASAKSITIGTSGTDERNYLVIQASLTVGAGGVVVNGPSAIVLQAAPNTPFTSSGDVTFNGTETFFFQSGAISGSGAWNVLAGSRINLNNAGEKLITGTTLYNYGTISISGGALVQLEKKGQIYSTGSIDTTDSATFLSQDGTGSVNTKGLFVYTSTANTQTLTLQTPANFENGIIIVGSGAVTIQDAVVTSGFYAPNATVVVAGNGALEIDASKTVPASFYALSLQAGSATQVNGDVKIANLDLNEAKISNDGRIQITQATIRGGALTGSNGQISVANVDFVPPANVPFNIDSGFTVAGSARVFNATTLLINSNGFLWFLPTASLYVDAALQFQLISGTPNVTIDGDVQVNADVYTNVNIAGAAAWNISGFSVLLQAVSFQSGDIICRSCAITASASKLNVGNFIGGKTGHLNVQANPTASFLSVSAEDLVVTSGTVDTVTVELQELNITSGSLSFQKNSSATTVSFYGGAFNNVAPAVTLATTETYFRGAEPKTVSDTNILATKYGFDCGASCTIILNNATLNQ